MAIIRANGTENVVDAARRRIKNAFSNGVKIYAAFSSGKDSLCLSHLLYSLSLNGEIDPSLLSVIFIDEEALYPSQEEMALEWRKRFIAIGAKFLWYCLPVKQVSMLDKLSNEESWITWEPGKEDCWCRQPPPWAITRDPILKYAGEMNYQTFLRQKCKDGLMLTGVRACESVQRIKYIASMDMFSGKAAGNRTIYPIYDWKDGDVWLYIKENGLKFPQAYMDLFQAGQTKRQMRMCNFFASESIAGLRWIAQTCPELWERVLKREPNAYLALLYWDSEMFRRNTKKRQELEKDETPKDYKALCEDMLLKHFDEHFTTKAKRDVARQYRKLLIEKGYMFNTALYKRMYEALVYGDPKKRSLRAIITVAGTDYVKEGKTQ